MWFQFSYGEVGSSDNRNLLSREKRARLSSDLHAHMPGITSTNAQAHVYTCAYTHTHISQRVRGVQDLRYFLDDIIYDCCPNVLISVPQLSFSRAGFPINFSSRCGIFLFKILKIILLGMTFLFWQLILGISEIPVRLTFWALGRAV